MEGSVTVSLTLALVGVQSLAMLLALAGLAWWFNQRLAQEREQCVEEIRQTSDHSRQEMHNRIEELRNGFERERLQMEAKMMQAFQQREQMYQELRLHVREKRLTAADESMNFNVSGDVNVGGDVLGNDKNVTR